MSFLIFNDKTQGVEVSKEIKNLNEILLLKENDKSKNKTYFNDCLKYIYHTYKKEHPFYNTFPVMGHARKGETDVFLI